MNLEKKYIINTETYQKILKDLEKHTRLDSYNQQQEFYTISNLYFDTEDNNLIRTSISKPKYKEKLRLRAYGVPEKFDNVYLEVKKKYKGIVNKRRTSFELSEAYAFIESGTVTPKEYMNRQVINEIEYFIHLYKPMPKVYLAYDRRAYVGENGLRITFDTNIRTRRYNLKLEKGDYGEALIDGDLWIMEVKTPGAIPLWFAKILSENQVYCTGFSKYGTEYKKLINEQMKGERQCLNQFSVPQEKLSPYRRKTCLSPLS